MFLHLFLLLSITTVTIFSCTPPSSENKFLFHRNSNEYYEEDFFPGQGNTKAIITTISTSTSDSTSAQPRLEKHNSGDACHNKSKK